MFQGDHKELDPLKIKDGYVIIHGHFYQPPRESPWLEIIETEESAHPFHDWNERITFECYRPNAHARIVDSQGRILKISNNYSSMSFNFGPTLLPWLERKFPSVYQKILDADREGLRQFGHGNALAQVYNHIIMPLANERDKGTEVLWGIVDFEKRFHRRPEAMWLPETAVNYPTLQVLVKHGMRYLILSPFQALRVRPLGGKRWVDVSQGRIDPTQPYRCFIKDGSGKKVSDQSIDIFFYDGIISKEVAFGDLLKDGNTFCERFRLAYEPSKKRSQLIHIATDGETYGHHKKFGDMALAYAMEEGFSSRGFEVINYGAFLKRFPPVHEVEIDEGPKGEGTSWSCAHGVGRWKEDCGCSTGGRTGWNQKWREPLREAINLLRDELALIFEKEGEKVFKDVWEARNSYIDVILDRSPDNLDRFFNQYGLKGLRKEERIKGLKLLEMERHALQMFTSCGWFFADLSGLETMIVLQHAARAMELAQDAAGKDIERMFLDPLSKAKSNLPEMGDGRQVYQSLVKPRSVTLDKVVNHYAISSLYSQQEMQRKVFSYRIEKVKGERMEKDNSWLVLGQVKVTPEAILEPKEFLFGLSLSSKDIFRTWILEDKEMDFNRLKEKTLQSLGGSEDEIAKTLTSLLGDHVYTIRETFKEEKQAIFQRLIEKELKEHFQCYADLFYKNRQIIEALVREGMEIPYEIKVAAEVTLSDRLLQEIKGLRKDFSRTVKRGEIERIVEEAREHNFQLRKEESIRILNEMLKEEMEVLQRTVVRNRATPTENIMVQEERVKKVILLLDLATRWGFELLKEEPQNLMGEILAECIGNLEECWWGDGAQTKTIFPQFVTLADMLGFNVEKLSKMLGSSLSAGQST
jgi:alpha-amylase/alpha-mannosidase (GH57 family)